MTASSVTAVFVHGWGVTNTSSYGGLPARLRDEASAKGLDVRIRHIFLGRYMSFHDEVRLPDVSRAFRAAVADELQSLLTAGDRFVCITHSTGGPVIRDWWHRYYDQVRGSGICPMSHLIMLAPANHGSALAQLGKGRIGRLKSWLGGVEPGQGILDWLELGSAEAWELNSAWIRSNGSKIAANGIFPFVLTGQAIDRAFYDHLNTYTGESGSDGVVRVAASNLNARIVTLTQEAPRVTGTEGQNIVAPFLKGGRVRSAPETALRIVRRASHFGKTMGIMRGVHKKVGHRKGQDVVSAVLGCLAVQTKADYRKLVDTQRRESARIQEEERLETEKRILARPTHFIHDRYSMVVFRVTDDHGYPVDDFDLLLTAGPDNDPNDLPRGFFMDRQRNTRTRNIVTYFLNYDIMTGAPEVTCEGEILRPATEGAESLGFRLSPRPTDGFVHYLDCEIQASKRLLKLVLRPNSTTLVDIRLRRIVKKNVFRLAPMHGDSTSGGFRKTRPETDIAD